MTQSMYNICVIDIQKQIPSYSQNEYTYYMYIRF